MKEEAVSSKQMAGPTQENDLSPNVFVYTKGDKGSGVECGSLLSCWSIRLKEKNFKK